jgi:hypothetical protein
MSSSWWSSYPQDCVASVPCRCRQASATYPRDCIASVPVVAIGHPRLHGAACSCKDRLACFLFPNMQDFLALIRPLAVVLNENVMQSFQHNVVFHRCPFDPGHKMPFVPQNTHKSIIHYRTSLVHIFSNKALHNDHSIHHNRIQSQNRPHHRSVTKGSQTHPWAFSPPLQASFALSLTRTALGLINRLNPDRMGCYWAPLTSR